MPGTGKKFDLSLVTPDGATLPAPLEGVAGLPKLLDALAEAGFTLAEIEQIAWQNWRRVLAAWWH